MKTLHVAIIVAIGIVAVISSFNGTLAQNATNSSNSIPPIPYSILGSPVPTLTPSENQTIVNIALSVPGLQSWSHDWQYVSTGFGGNNKLATVGFEWEYAMVDLKAPSSSAPVACDQGWQAEITVDMTTMKVVSADYPTMESHNCDNYTIGGGPGTSEIPPMIESPLKQFESGIPLQKIQCKTDLVLVIREGTGTPACVYQSDVAKLVYRGWAGLISSQPEPAYRIVGQYDGLQNPTGIVTIQNKTFFMTTFNGTLNPTGGYQEVAFHGINFTLFPQPQSLEISGKEFYADVGFTDNHHEQLWLNPPIYADMGNITITRLTQHVSPQAGIVSYNEQIKLLVSTDVNPTVPQTTTSNSSSGPEYKVGPDLLGPLPHQLVFFMKSNSTAKIFAEYTSDLSNTGTLPTYSSVYLGNNGNFTPLTTSDVTIIADPPSIPLTKDSDTVVVYNVTAKEGARGVYWIFLVQFCRVMPLAVDINSLTISPTEIPVQTGTMYCPAQELDGKILGISGGSAEYKIGVPVH